MRLLIISDVHANFTALEQLNEPADKIVFLGDAVNYGIHPAECVEWIREHADIAVRGNHDEAFGQSVDVHFAQSFGDSVTDPYELDRSVLSVADRHYLRDLPLEAHFEFCGVRFYAVHATPKDPLYGYLRPNMTDAEWERQIGHIEVDVILLGHTHLSQVRRVGAKLIINPGSIGVRERNVHQGTYALWDDGEVTLKTFDYSH